MTESHQNSHSLILFSLFNFLHRFLRYISGLIVAFLLVSGLNGFLSIQPANASNLNEITASEAFAVYIDRPYVQSSYIAEDFPSLSLTDNYNSNSPDNSACPVSGFNVGTYSGGDCKILFGNHSGTYQFGGAVTESSTPTTGGTQSTSAGIFDSTGTDITFASSKNYVGFWWSAGSTLNSVKFYQGTALVLTLAIDDVCSAVKSASGCVKGSTDTHTVSALDGSTYPRINYFGHPKSTSTLDPNEPFTYVHVFAQNGITFTKMNISTSGNGFEFDNLTVANLSSNALPSNSGTSARLVPVRSYGTTYNLIYNSNGGSNIDTQTLVSGGKVSISSSRPTKSGYTFSSWNDTSTGTGTSYAPGATYPTSGNVSGNGSLYAQWTPLTYSINYFDSNTASASGADGGTAPSAQSGSGVGTVTLSQNTLALSNYAFSGWATSNGSTTVAYTDLGVIAIDTNTVVNLYPVWIRTYTIAASSDLNGSISTSGTTTVRSGSSQSYSFSPISGYKISDVLVDGVSQGAITSYTFTNVSANHTISVIFEKIPTSSSSLPTYIPQKSPEQIAAELAAQKLADEKAAEVLATQQKALSDNAAADKTFQSLQDQINSALSNGSTSKGSSTKAPAKISSSSKSSSSSSVDTSKSGLSVPEGTILITPTQIASLEIAKSSSGNSANIAISQLKSGQRVKVTVISKADLNSNSIDLGSTQITEVTPNPSSLASTKSPTSIAIKPAPKTSASTANKAQVSVTGAKKNQRVRVTVKSK